LWAERIEGIKKMSSRAKEWRDVIGLQGMGESGVVVEEK
jgi:hypothetical protein